MHEDLNLGLQRIKLGGASKLPLSHQIAGPAPEPLGHAAFTNSLYSPLAHLP